jgi:hypothetical protein
MLWLQNHSNHHFIFNPLRVWSMHVLTCSALYINPALLASSFVWQIQLYFLYISLFKIIQKKYFIWSKFELMKFLFALLDKIKTLPLCTFYLPHQLLHMLFFSPFRSFWATVFLYKQLKTWLNNFNIFFSTNWNSVNYFSFVNLCIE